VKGGAVELKLSRTEEGSVLSFQDAEQFADEIRMGTFDYVLDTIVWSLMERRRDVGRALYVGADVGTRVRVVPEAGQFAGHPGTVVDKQRGSLTVQLDGCPGGCAAAGEYVTLPSYYVRPVSELIVCGLDGLVACGESFDELVARLASECGIEVNGDDDPFIELRDLVDVVFETDLEATTAEELVSELVGLGLLTRLDADAS
jgi:hypothetical protein